MIKLAVDSGITDLRTIRDVYNSYAEGGLLKDYRSGGNLFETGGPEKQNWFTKATLGAAMADAPAVMQSMGWQYDDNNNLYQGDWSEEGPTKLREDLAEIASVPMWELGLGLAGNAIGSALSTPYANAAKKRLAEVIIRAGDEAHNGNKLLQQILNRKSLKYVLNPKADARLAYELPFRYSGETTEFTDAHMGDVVDQFLRKTKPVNEKIVNINSLPEDLKNYFSSHYPNMKEVSVSDLGYATNNPPLESVYAAKKLMPGEAKIMSGEVGAVRINGKPVLDPGGHMQFIGKDAAGNVSIKGRDVWKFHPDDYVERYFKDETDLVKSIAKKGLQFIDSAGEPIIYNWEYPGSMFEGLAIPQARGNGGKIHIKPENRGHLFETGGFTEEEFVGPPAPYIPSDSIKDYIKGTEAFRSNWYKDANGIDTVGYGFTGSKVKELYPNGMTKQQADNYFDGLVTRFARRMSQLTPNIDRLTQNQKDALFSYFYNIGEGTYSKKSPKMQKALQDMDWDAVVQNIDAGYNDKKNPGLKKRRDYERALFEMDIPRPLQPIPPTVNREPLYNPTISRFNTTIPFKNGKEEVFNPFMFNLKP